MPVTREIVASWPKIDLHRHLCGSLRMETQMKIAAEYRLPLPYDNPKEFKKHVKFGPEQPPDLLKFLEKFHSDWYHTLEIVERFAYEGIIDAAADNIVYLELRFSPAHFARLKKFPEHETTAAILKGCKRAQKETGIMLKYIITLGRHKQAHEELFRTIDAIGEFKNDGLVALDLAGDEINHPPEDFIDVFDYARSKYSLKTTIHAGEVAGPEQVITSIKQLHADRIGHGVTSLKSEEAMQLLVETHTPLEMSLTSNLQTGAVRSLENHPAKALLERGVIVTLNSDDPGISDITLTDDYCLALNKAGFSREQFTQLLANGVIASFTTDKEKALIADKLGIADFYRNSLKK